MFVNKQHKEVNETDKNRFIKSM